ncbi:MAG: hypothetical protein M1830_010269 [Pleopsidium flavum]|nr:MAG: hypothetical protein M1830_010269 [Pleopsidium flavum]
MASWNHREVTNEHILPYVDSSTASPGVAETLNVLPVQRNIAKLLANAECFFAPLMKVLSCSWADNRTIRSSEWQLVVLRTAASLDAPQEWDVNEPVARIFGFDTDEKLKLIRSGDLSSTALFTERHRLINKMVRELVQQDKVQESTVLEGKKIFGAAGVIEIIIIHGLYALLAMVMRSSKQDFDPPIEGLEDTLRKFNATAIAKEKALLEQEQVHVQSNGTHKPGPTDGLQDAQTKSKVQNIASALTFRDHGPQAAEALRLQSYPVPSPREDQLLVKVIAAPINPQDLLIIAGTYPVRPEHHIDGESIPGYDGVARVLEIGSNIKSFAPGDLVIPAKQGLGTWRTHAVCSESDLLQIDADVDLSCASILKMSVMPAYFLLEDMRTLKPGDWIIQNAGSGTIAQMVSQFCRLRGVHTISVIRDRGVESDSKAIKASLQHVGADIVLFESEVTNATGLDDLRIVLALDSVFGKAAEQIAARLVKGGTFVNYGFLGSGGSSAKFVVTEELLFGKMVNVKSFRSSESLSRRSGQEIKDLLTWFVTLFMSHALTVSELEMIDWDHNQAECEPRLKDAIDRSQKRNVGERKKVLRFA